VLSRLLPLFPDGSGFSEAFVDRSLGRHRTARRVFTPPVVEDFHPRRTGGS
jgi:hypothetical protein